MTDAVAELLIRYELGDFSPRIRQRLASIFREDPPDALQRLAKAADFIGITTVTESTLSRAQASLSSRTPGVQKAGTVKRGEPRT